MIRQSAIGMVANVAIAADMAKARAEEAVNEVAELRGKLKETLKYLGEYSGHVDSRSNNILMNRGEVLPCPTLPTL